MKSPMWSPSSWRGKGRPSRLTIRSDFSASKGSTCECLLTESGPPAKIRARIVGTSNGVARFRTAADSVPFRFPAPMQTRIGCELKYV
jgi:hypothetical protein